MRVLVFWTTIVVPLALSVPCPHSYPVVYFANTSCTGFDDGHYPINDGCNKIFKVCVGNKFYDTECPDNLVFNPKKNHCDKTKYVDACKGTHTRTAAPTTTKPIRKNCNSRRPIGMFSWDKLKKVYCINKNDGLYNLWDCDSWYIKCENGTTTSPQCPTKPVVRVFNPETNQCDDQKNVKVCKTNNDDSSWIIPDYSQYEDESKKTSLFDTCSGRMDGQYPTEACSQTFKICVSKVRYEVKCPADLVYSPQKNHCDRSENVKWCSGKPAESKPLNCNAIEKPPIFQTWMTKWHKIQEIFCCRKKDGDYTLWGCSSYYISCVNGNFIMPQCPGNLVFNPDTSKCDDEDNVKTCQYVPPTTTTTQRPRPQLRVKYAPVHVSAGWY